MTWEVSARESRALRAACRAVIEKADCRRQGRLRRVEGWLVDGKALWIADYEVEVDGRVETQSEFPDFPASSPGPEHFQFFEEHREGFLQLVADGLAVSLGAEDRMIDRRPFHVWKWRAEVPGFGTVIYWEGDSPLP